MKIYPYGYLNQVQSSRRLERECARNLELIWLTRRLGPDFKTIADFRRDNSPAIRKVCQQFVALCRDIDLLDASIVAIDGSVLKGDLAAPIGCLSIARRYLRHSFIAQFELNFPASRVDDRNAALAIGCATPWSGSGSRH